MPAFDSSPARFTSISTSLAGCFSSCRSADSDATEWISRTLGATSLTLRLWSAPMKSQVNSPACCSRLASRSCARFSPTSSMPPSASAGSSSADTYLIAARTSTSAGSRPAAALDDAGRQAAPAAVEHDGASVRHQRERKAIRHQHHERNALRGGGVAVDLRQVGAHVCETAVLGRAVPLEDL